MLVIAPVLASLAGVIVYRVVRRLTRRRWYW